VRLPYINLRWVAATLVLLLVAAAAAGGWLWYNGRPDKLWESALDYYNQGEKLRGVGNPQAKPSEDDKTKAKNAYEHARAQVKLFTERAPKNDPRIPEAHVLSFKILWALAGLKPDEQGNLQAEAFREGETAAALDEKNIQAQAIVVFDHFRLNDFDGAYPAARALIDNLPPETQKVDLENFDDYVVGAYYVLALKDLKSNRPDDVIKDLDAGLAREKAGPSGRVQRWRALAVEVAALSKKADPANTKDSKAVRDAENRLRTVLNQSVERARAELKETVPPADGKPELPRVASMSLTNTTGLIDVLLASVAKADSHQAVADRAQVLLDVCDKMANTPQAASHVYQEAVRGATRLVFMNGGLPATNRLDPKEMTEVQGRAVDINKVVQQNGGQIDPSAFLEMARTVMATQGNRERALELCKRGEKLAADQHIKADDPRVLALQAEAAWLLLLDHKVPEAEEYLKLIAKQQRLGADVAYMRGLGAILDGRLEDGVQQLSIAAKEARFKQSLPLLLGLAHAYLSMGQVENAAPVLEEIIKLRKVQEGKNRDDEPWVKIWQPSLTHATLDLLKCYLALALKAPNKQDAKAYADRAGALAKELQNTFLANDAQAAVLDYDMARLRALEAKDPNGIEADVLRGNIARSMEKLPPTVKNDPRVLWAEVNLIVSQKETNPDVIGSAIAGALGAPTDLAVRMGEVGRLRAGYGWQWLKAEERLMKAVSEQKDSMATQLAWVSWLLNNNRTEEAVAKLTELEDKANDEGERTRIRAARARLLLAEGKKDEADRIIQEMRAKGGPDLTAGDMLYMWEILLGKNPKSQQELDVLLSKQDQTGLGYYLRGAQAQAKGEYVQAIQSYERALEYTQFKQRSESAILTCVMGIINGPPGKSDKANPEAALKETRELRKRHPRNPGVLLSFAIAARVMDEVYGEDGMEGALADLVIALNNEKTFAANGPYVAAQQWVAAGRPDLARQALKNNRKHLPSLVLATRLAVADEDWSEVADDLKAVTAVAPDAVDLPLWRAMLHEARNETREARELYEKFVADHPTNSTGYLALARLHERAKEYNEALSWVKKWREKQPDDLTGLNAQVRVLAEDGQAAEATKVADAYIKEQVAMGKAAREEWEAKNPITEKDPEKAKEEADKRAKERQMLPDVLELTLTLQLVGIFQEAKAFAEAEKWLDRAGPQLAKLPEEAQKRNRISLKMVKGSILMSRGRALPEKDPERKKLMDAAIQEFDDVYKEQPGDLIAGNNLAWLLVKEKNESSRAVALVDEVRKGKFSRKTVSPERLPVEFLDTLGTVYHAGGLNQESLDLFKQAIDSHYVREPRLIMYLGLAQEGLQRKAEAFATFDKVINLADAQAKATPDPLRKERLEKLVADAKKEQKNIGIK
jgi:tetratricopeptide (TPR) repeat protein